MRPMRLLGLKTFRHGVHPPESKGRDEWASHSSVSLRAAPHRSAGPAHGGAIDPRGGGGAGSPTGAADREARRFHVGVDARSGFRSGAQDRAGAEHQRPHGAGGVSGAVSPAPRRRSRTARPARSRRQLPTRSSTPFRKPAWSGSGARRFQPTSSSRSPRASTSTR